MVRFWMRKFLEISSYNTELTFFRPNRCQNTIYMLGKIHELLVDFKGVRYQNPVYLSQYVLKVFQELVSRFEKNFFLSRKNIQSLQVVGAQMIKGNGCS